jgi:hypothetical protein
MGLQDITDASKAVVSKREWELSDEEIESICRPVQSAKPSRTEYRPPEPMDRGAPPTRTQPKTQRGVNPFYTSITQTSEHEDALGDSISGFLERVKTAFPELNYPALDRYVCIAFVYFNQGQLPFLVRILQGLSDIERRDVLAQYMARRASYVHGWHSKDISNPIGFIKTLVERLRKDEFVLDSMGSEFVLAIASKVEPVISDTPEKQALIRARSDKYLTGEIPHVN